MNIPAGRLLGAAACSIAGPVGYFLFPALAVSAEIAKEFVKKNEYAEAIAAVSVHVFSEMSGERAGRLLEKLQTPGANHDLEKVFIEAMEAALEAAREELSPSRRKEYREWFKNWEARLTWAGADASRASILFLGGEAFDPVKLASASESDAWAALRKSMERWAFDQKAAEQPMLVNILGEPERMPDPLSAHLEAHLLAHVEKAIPLVLRDKENSAGWIAWQQRFLETTYFEVRGVRDDLAKAIEGLANLGGVPPLLDRLRVDVLSRFDRQDRELNSRLDRLEEMLALRAVVASFRRDEPAMQDGMRAEPADYLRTLWSRTQTIDLAHFQPPDGTARQFFIERLYTRLTTVIAEEAPARLGALEKAGKAGDIPLHEALKNHRLLLLVGDPGSGKTTFLKRISFEMCHVGLGRNRAWDDGRSRIIERLTEYEWDMLPLLIDAKQLATHIWEGGVPPRGALADRSDPAWLFHYLGETCGLTNAWFESQARRGCVVLVDAFDEVPDEVHRVGIGELLQKLASDERYQKTRIVGTSRPGEHGGLTRIAGFRTARIGPLGDKEIDAFVENWGRAVHPANEEASAALTGMLRDEIRRPQVRILAKNPMMLTALAVLHFAEKARLPEQRSELYKYILEWLARRRAARKNDGGGYRDFLAKMRLLAMHMSSGKKEMRAEIDLEEAIDVVEKEFQQARDEEKRRQAARTFLLEEEVHSGMIIKSGSNVRFWHLTFREALTAQSLAEEEKKWAQLVFTKRKLCDRSWRETLLLLAGELRAISNSKVNGFLDKALKLGEASGARLADRARCVGLMGAMLKDLGAWQYSMTGSLSDRYHALLHQVEDIFDKEKAYQIPFEDRLAAANALGQAGDPRLEQDNRILVPGGRFWMGAQKGNPKGRNFDPEAYDDEKPREIQVAPFLIGRYLVTVDEYKRFIEEDGYGNPRHWSSGGLGQFKAPDEWEKQLEYLNRPVTGISWYEAAAYCAWAGGRLPKEAEWECAARAGRDGVRYPWGPEDPDERRANYSYEGSPQAPTPVGLYPAGATPTGIHDLAGNVWEWVEDDYDKENKVLRGGGWGYSPGYLRVSDRDGIGPAVRNGNVGFRCVWESVSP